ncbi:MAG TPA: trypsin-like peptidase domain-containing protein [Vicinamibacterales bacterium]|nr:trypsin-like peptidase domain-containing protein [Vicinamibacterales bacterium]
MRPLTIAVAICLNGAVVSAQERAVDGTVLIRVTGDVTVSLSDEAGATRRQTELSGVELGTGSGMIVSRYGHVVTNHHVIAGGELRGRINGVPATMTLTVQRVEVCLPGSTPDRSLVRFDASVVAVDPELDLAILAIPGNDLPYVSLGDSDSLRAGQPVSVVGYPLGDALDVGRPEATDSMAPTMGTGIVSALREDASGNVRYIQTSAPLNRGNSGGPLLDRAGFAAGVVQMKLTRVEGIAFAIPINLVKDFLARNGVDTFLPATRLTLGPLYDAPGKLIRLHAVTGFEDGGPSRLAVDSGSSLAGVALHIDRVATGWSLEQLEEELRTGRAFEPQRTAEAGPRTRTERVLRAESSGLADGRPVRMMYSLVDLGGEKIVARYVGSAEQIAFNQSVLAASLASLEAAPMLATGPRSAQPDGWVAVVPASGLEAVKAIPAGWTLDAGAPLPCGGLPAVRTALFASPRHDFTVSFAAGQHDTALAPARAARACAAGRGSATEATYRYRFSRLGVEYAVEGQFLGTDSGTLQLEMVVPTRDVTAARDLFQRWLAELAAGSR